jgi:hypothetical protein
MTKKRCSVAAHFPHFGFVIHSSFVIQAASFSRDELPIALVDSARPAVERSCDHIIHAPMEIIEQCDFHRRCPRKFRLQLLDLRSVSNGRT